MQLSEEQVSSCKAVIGNCQRLIIILILIIIIIIIIITIIITIITETILRLGTSNANEWYGKKTRPHVRRFSK